MIENVNTTITISEGYITVSNKVKDHYIDHYRAIEDIEVSTLHSYSVADPDTEELILCVRMRYLREVYGIPGHIPDVQLVKYIERKL